jgi:hypothetical protein
MKTGKGRKENRHNHKQSDVREHQGKKGRDLFDGGSAIHVSGDLTRNHFFIHAYAPPVRNGRCVGTRLC